MKAFNIDYDRENRLGFPEIIYGQSKTVETLTDILLDCQTRTENAMVTKLQSEKAHLLQTQFPDSFFDGISGVFALQLDESKLRACKVAIIAAGTSDLAVVNEIYFTLAFLGLQSERILDVGVSGIHRLLNRKDDLLEFDVLIVVAGFEGTLPSVVGGLLPQPVIAVPTSIGYGVAAQGQAALHAMLASCANGIVVVNVDNGYGAAIAAYRILQQLDSAKHSLRTQSNTDHESAID